jgi:serine/threonine protein kinase
MSDKVEFSLSNLRYSRIPSLINVQRLHIRQVIRYDIRDVPPLPEFCEPDGKTPFDLTKRHTWGEDKVQKVANNALLNRCVGKTYYFHDKHLEATFLGSDLKPDFMVTYLPEIQVIGEPQVAFMMDVKQHKSNPACDSNLGQAIAYAVRLLEVSDPTFRPHAVVVVTNLMEAMVLKVSRSSTASTKFSCCYAVTTAIEAFNVVFNAGVDALGFFGMGFVEVAGTKMMLSRHLGNGSSSVVYGTMSGDVVKFYTSHESLATFNIERDVLIKLNNAYDINATFRLQRVVAASAGEEPGSYPFLVMSPLGEAYCPRKAPRFSRSAFMKCFDALKFAHKLNVIHNDIRPENIILLPDGNMMLIDFAAAWNVGLMELTDDNQYRSEYRGCVSFAAPSILDDLMNSTTDGDDSYLERHFVVSASKLTDCIAFLRTAFSITQNVSASGRSDLLLLRNQHNFVGIKEWWEARLPPDFKQLEEHLKLAFEVGGDIHSLMEEFILSRLPETL